jgi:hypothetical protein
LDDTGRIGREVKVASEPEALLPVLKNPAYHFKRIGLEAGPGHWWIFVRDGSVAIDPQQSTRPHNSIRRDPN